MWGFEAWRDGIGLKRDQGFFLRGKEKGWKKKECPLCLLLWDFVERWRKKPEIKDKL